MEKMNPTVMVYAILLSLSFSILVSMCEGAKKPVGVARKEDIPYIKCQVCQKLASQLHNHVRNKQTQISPKKISEYEIIEIVENVCNLKKAEADWILLIDIVEKEDRLELLEQDSEGQCNSECKTIERACQEVIEYSDTDLAEYIYTAKPDLDALVNFLCKDLTRACTKKPPSVPKDRAPGEPFIAKSSKEAEMDKLLKSMEGMPGAPNMKMYSRDDLMNMKNPGDVDTDDDDEDEDDEADVPSKLGEVLRQKESTKGDWKQRVRKGFVDAGAALKRHGVRLKKHVNRASTMIRRWWSGKKRSSSTKKQTTGKSEL